MDVYANVCARSVVCVCMRSVFWLVEEDFWQGVNFTPVHSYNYGENVYAVNTRQNISRLIISIFFNTAILFNETFQGFK